MVPSRPGTGAARLPRSLSSLEPTTTERPGILRAEALQNRGCAVTLRRALTVLPDADFSHSADFKRMFEVGRASIRPHFA
jgi:hypothetical protein